MQTQQNSADTRTILRAEDDVLVRMSLAEFLRGCGYKVLEAPSADEAILLIEDGTFEVDLGGSNVEIAGDGFGIAKWLREHRPELDLQLTGTTQRAVEIAASLCANGPLPAPFDPQILHRRIGRLLAGRRPRPNQGRQASTARKASTQ